MNRHALILFQYLSPDPPFISYVINGTVVYSPNKKQTAVLECAVDNREDWLNVSISWTATGDMEITAPHTVVEANNVSYLLFHKISNWKNKSHFYTCNVYSDFGLEDERVLQVIFLGNMFLILVEVSKVPSKNWLLWRLIFTINLMRKTLQDALVSTVSLVCLFVISATDPSCSNCTCPDMPATDPGKSAYKSCT